MILDTTKQYLTKNVIQTPHFTIKAGLTLKNISLVDTYTYKFEVWLGNTKIMDCTESSDYFLDCDLVALVSKKEASRLISTKLKDASSLIEECELLAIINMD